MRRPGMRKERGTQVGARRNKPSPASSAWRTALSGLGAGGGAGGWRLFFVATIFLAMLKELPAIVPNDRRKRHGGPCCVYGHGGRAKMGIRGVLIAAQRGASKDKLARIAGFTAGPQPADLMKISSFSLGTEKV